MSDMKYVDIHAHLDFPDFEADQEQVLAEMKSLGIGSFNVGTTIESCATTLDLIEKHDHVWGIFGIHPLHTHETSLEDLARLEEYVAHPKCVAIGECGLDFFREANDVETKARQLSFFENQIELALKYNKPLMIHCRQAYPETLEVLERYKVAHPELHAHFHFFTEPIETAQRILDLGFTVSFTGVITFVKDYEELVRFVPLESMMIETDSPFVAPKSHRGQRNDPRYVPEIAQKIAEIKGLNLQEVSDALMANTRRIFGI